MPVLVHPIFYSIDQIFSGRTGTPFDALSAKRTYVQRYRVIVKVNDAAAVLVCSCPGLPIPYAFYFTSNGSTYEYDTQAYMVRMRAEQEYADDWSSWIVTCDYSTETPPGGKPDDPGFPDGGDAGGPAAGGRERNPDQQPPDVRWSFEVKKRVVQYDLDGWPIVNRANQPIVYEEDVAFPVLNITRNELNFDQDVASEYAFALNADTFLGAEPNTAQILPPDAQMDFLGPLRFWRVSYKIRFTPLYSPQQTFVICGKAPADAEVTVLRSRESWQPLLLNQGTMRRRLVGTDKGKPVPIIKDSHPINNPILLDNNGQELTPDAAGRLFPRYLEFRTRRSVNFASLFRAGYVPT